MKRPVSNSPGAIRQRRLRDKRRAAKDSGGSDSKPAPPVGGTVPTGGVPFHRTTPIANASPDRYASPPVMPPSSPDAEPSPVVPPAPPPPEGAPPPAAPGPTPITQAEAKFFAKCVVGYFKLGTGLLIAKREDVQVFLQGLAQDPEVAKALSPEGQASILGFISECAERTAVRWNLRIPYMDEVVCVGAIGIATLGFVPVKRDPNAKPRNANPPPQQPQRAQANGAQPQQPTQPIVAVDDVHGGDIPDMASDVH